MAFANGVNGRLLNALGAQQGSLGAQPQLGAVPQQQPTPYAGSGMLGAGIQVDQPVVSPSLGAQQPIAGVQTDQPVVSPQDPFSNPAYQPPQPDIQVDPPQYQMPRDPLVKQPSPWAGAGVNTPFARAWPGVSQPRQPRAWPQSSGTPQWGGGQTRFRTLGR